MRLAQGDYDAATVYERDPARGRAALRASAGARACTWSTSTARKAGSPVNGARGARDRRRASAPIPVQLGGGIRDLDGVEAALALGVDRVDPRHRGAARSRARARGGARAIPGASSSASTREDGRVAVEGWLETSETTARRSGAALRGRRRRGDRLHRHRARRHARRARTSRPPPRWPRPSRFR